MKLTIPSVADLRRAAAGAAVGARLALGPDRWCVLRAAWRALVVFGWLALAVYLVAVISIMWGVT